MDILSKEFHGKYMFLENLYFTNFKVLIRLMVSIKNVIRNCHWSLITFFMLIFINVKIILWCYVKLVWNGYAKSKMACLVSECDYAANGRRKIRFLVCLPLPWT